MAQKFSQQLAAFDNNNPLLSDDQLLAGCQIVNDKVARNSIPVNKRKIGMAVCWIDSSQTIFKKYIGSDTTNGNWTNDYNWVDTLYALETVNRTIYVATTGSDTTGDGSVGNPFATLEFAISTIKSIFAVNVAITISLTAGTYSNVDWNAISVMIRDWVLLDGATLTIAGSMTQLATGFTLAAESPGAYIYDVTGATFTVNQYQDKYLLAAGAYYPIMSNGASTIKSFPGLAAATSIYDTAVTVNMASNLLDIVVKYPALKNQRITIKNIKLTPASGGLNLYVSGIQFTLQECTIIANSFQINNGNASTDLLGINLVCSNNGYNNDSPFTQLSYCKARKTGSKAGYGVRYGSYFYRAQRSVYVSNCAQGLEFVAGLYPFNQTNHAVIIESCTNGMWIRNGTTALFTIETIYVDTVINLIASGETLNSNYAVNISTLVGTPTNYGDAGVLGLGFNNISRGIFIKLPFNTAANRNYIVPITKALTDGSPVGIFEVSIGSNEMIGGALTYTIVCSDATDFQSHSGVVTFSAVSKGATITSAINESAQLETGALSAGTLTDAWTIVHGTGKITITVNANTSFVSTTSFYIMYQIQMNTNNGVITPLS